MTIIPRMSFLGANRAAQHRLGAAAARMERANEQVASGRAFTKPSQSPSAASRAAVLQDQLDQLSTFGTAVDDARSRLDIADTKMQQAMNLYHRITELTTEAASSTTSGPARLSIREEVLQMRGELEAIANTQYLGAPLFAGFQAGDAVSWNGSSWVFAGSPAEQLRRRIAPGEDVTTNVTAAELFSTGSSDVFSVLDDLAAALQADDTAAIQATIAPMAALRSTLSSGQARVGAVANRVEQAAGRNSAVEVTLTAELSQVRDVDLSDAITDQGRLTIAYQAALGVTAKANQQTLLDYWR